MGWLSMWVPSLPLSLIYIFYSVLLHCRDGFSLLLVFLVIIKWSGQNRKCIFTACTSRTCLKIHCEIMFETKIILPRDHDSFLCLFCFYLLDLHWINVLNSVFKQPWYFIIPQKKKKRLWVVWVWENSSFLKGWFLSEILNL